MLVAGNVIIGRKDEGLKGIQDGGGSPPSSASDAEGDRGTYHRIPGVDEPVFIPREEKDGEGDILDLEAEGTR